MNTSPGPQGGSSGSILGTHRSTGWTAEDAGRIGSREEVQVLTGRADGTLAAPRTIWIVSSGDRLFVRSTNGRTAGWFRGAIASGRGVIRTGDRTFDVAFTEAADSELTTVDAAYRRKYGRYASIVDHLEETGPRSATLEVHPG